MPRLSHGGVLTLEEFRNARDAVAEVSAQSPLAFAVMARAVDTQDFGFLLPSLQDDPDNLLPERRRTRDALVELGKSMRSLGGGNSPIPAAYTYFGQFVDHDITLELESAELPDLVDPHLTPLGLPEIRQRIRNARTATLELDSVYGEPAPRDGDKMRIGRVTPSGRRPPGKDDRNDLPRRGRSDNPERDREARIGDPRNDENLIVSQLHVAFLRAHNRLVSRGEDFQGARRLLRQHYQHIILNDFLKKIADPQIVDETIEQNRIYRPPEDRPFMPLEFSVGAYRLGHSMVRAEYNFNLNFQPATFDLLFTFTALSGQLGSFDTLPQLWIIEWENFVDVGEPFNQARSIDTMVVEPLFELPDIQGQPLQGNRARLAVRNLLRGYLLRLPTGQAVAGALGQRLQGVRNIPVLSPQQIRDAAASDEQVQVLRDAGFLERTPLWYYILAEAASIEGGERLGPVGSTIVAEVLVGLIRRSAGSILRTANWQPTLPSDQAGTFTLTDLLKFARVLG
ncbi:MAG: heme peroxidase family protein [Actinomycetota bacterium]|nr:heme peroxidase family protein [Actinomycetota bacterium]